MFMSLYYVFVFCLQDDYAGQRRTREVRAGCVDGTCIIIKCTFKFMNSFKLLTRFDNKLAINLALCIKFNLQNMFFEASSSFLSILVTCLSIRTVKVMYFSVFSLKEVTFFLLLTLLW